MIGVKITKKVIFIKPNPLEHIKVCSIWKGKTAIMLEVPEQTYTECIHWLTQRHGCEKCNQEFKRI